MTQRITAHGAVESAPRFKAIDGLRGIAALMVVFLHVEWSNHLTGFRFARNGYLAVDLFFILSGFVIATNYSTRIGNVESFARFIALRFFRLYPLHLAVLTAFVALEVLKLICQVSFGIAPEHQPFTGGQTYWTLGANLLLIQGLGWLHEPTWNFPSWSISCEFFVYVVFAVAAWHGLLRKRAFVFVSALGALSAYLAIAITRETLNVYYGLGIVRAIAGFVLGMAIHTFSNPQTKSTRVNDWVGMIAAGGTVLALSFCSGWSVALIIPLFVVLVISVRSDATPVSRLLVCRIPQTLGQLSYSVYMVHSLFIVCILMVMKRLGALPVDPEIGSHSVRINPWIGDIVIACMILGLLLLASRAYRIIEEPGRAFGRQFVARRRRPASSSADVKSGFRAVSQA